eukprot:CAMPEP_0115509660 /NCGR_PEP_ID=MMETSP0271-20121206/72976_1 /TAXON_ID=71861 /ORGANISM="Scrippsiella trochoidea, Strain CCMP3099" /LENGTH=32 /DNA_ID= /DNA_START= /DNA_END= /DNA_ORIENTATION=
MTSFSLHMNWILNGPEILSARQSFLPIAFTRR